ncbi:restriction endonuclease subunit S [Ligilactobacillus salivarius]|nr:restriction endonuclease subunit S [Ligilactobacillus salivarius]UDE97418.1 restriction endonuclease subunit S [Ligilactobacillus salivarius]UUV96537.1 restriction endonuclease subunit S [Ligilactobacillus salivarius]
MDNKKNGIPELRFPGFTGAWEQRKLGEVATSHARIGWQNLRTSEFLNSGYYMLITGTDFKNGAIDFSNIHYVEKKRYDQDKNIQIKGENILVTKDGTLGKVAYIDKLSKPATLNTGVFNIKVIDKAVVNPQYLFQYLKAPFLLKFASEQSTGGTIKHLNQGVLIKFPIPLPSIDEQKKIANFFRSIESLIALHQRKLEHLQEQKKGLLQKMFPKNGETVPEVRFPGFTDAWEQRKLGDVATFKQGVQVGLEKQYTEKAPGRERFIRIVDYTQKTEDIRYIDKIPNANYVDKNDVVVVRYGAAGFVGHGISGIIANNMFTVNPFENLDKTYLYTYIKQDKIRKYLNSNSGSSTMPAINFNIMKTLPIPCSSIVEQKRIAGFFQQLDTLIALHQRKLEHLELMKKGLLQQMFV